MPQKIVKVGLVQMSVSSDGDENLRKAVDMIGEAAERGAEVVCLPELFGLMYFPAERGSRVRPETIPGPTTRTLAAAARKNSIVLIGGSIFESAGDKNYNTCLVFSEKGKILGKYRKVHLPEDEHYYEQDYFEPGRRYSVADTSRGRLGTLICYDQWYPEAARINRLMGADILFYPTAIGWVKGVEPVEGDWKQAWEAVQVGHAVANSVVVCAVNRVGVEDEITFWGGSFVCNQFGKVLLRAGNEEGVYVVECDLELQRVVEEGWGFLRNRRKETYGPLAE
jgi:agmatine deiminase